MIGGGDLSIYDAPFQEALQEKRLVIQRCTDCSSVVFPAGPCCSSCLSLSLEWREASGRGILWAFVIYHHAFHPSFADRIPYNVALVALEEGPQIVSNIIGIPNDLLRNGLQLLATFEPQPDGSVLLLFRPENNTPTGDL
jgi:uncharacterized OB-fold protein